MSATDTATDPAINDFAYLRDRADMAVRDLRTALESSDWQGALDKYRASQTVFQDTLAATYAQTDKANFSAIDAIAKNTADKMLGELAKLNEPPKAEDFLLRRQAPANQDRLNEIEAIIGKDVATLRQEGTSRIRENTASAEPEIHKQPSWVANLAPKQKGDFGRS